MLRPVTREQYVTVPVSGVARDGDICPDTLILTLLSTLWSQMWDY